MKMMWNSFNANMYKMVHLGLLMVHIALPVLAVGVFTAYYMVSSMEEVEKVKLYLQFIALLFPLIMTIIVTYVYERDSYAGSFQLLRMVPANKVWGHLGNLLSMLFLACLASLLAVAGFGLLNRGLGFSVTFYIRVWCLLWAVNIVGYILQYMVCYTWGKGVSIGVGIVGMLLAPLMCLGIGDKLWKNFPCSYGVRMVTYFIMKNTSEETSFYYNYLVHDYRVGGMVVAMTTFMCTIAFYFWGVLWQKS